MCVDFSCFCHRNFANGEKWVSHQKMLKEGKYLRKERKSAKERKKSKRKCFFKERFFAAARGHNPFAPSGCNLQNISKPVQIKEIVSLCEVVVERKNKSLYFLGLIFLRGRGFVFLFPSLCTFFLYFIRIKHKQSSTRSWAREVENKQSSTSSGEQAVEYKQSSTSSRAWGPL